MPGDLRARAHDERQRGRRAPDADPDETPGQLDLLTTLDTTDDQHQDQEDHSDE